MLIQSNKRFQSLRVFVFMSKRIVFSILVSTLLGACALDSMLVSAQVAGAGSPAVVNTPAAGPAAVAGASTTVATLQAEQSVSSVQDELEPEPAIKPGAGAAG